MRSEEGKVKRYGLGDSAHDAPFSNFCLQVWRTLVFGFHFLPEKAQFLSHFRACARNILNFLVIKPNFYVCRALTSEKNYDKINNGEPRLLFLKKQKQDSGANFAYTTVV